MANRDRFVPGLAHLPPHGFRQPREVVFHHVVVGSGPHHGHGGGLAHGARHHNKGQIAAAFLQNIEGGGGAKLGQLVVRKHHIPGVSLQGRLKVCRRFHLYPGGVKPAAAQLPQQQQAVVVRVFYN
jgi:hypothetical protein